MKKKPVVQSICVYRKREKEREWKEGREGGRKVGGKKGKKLDQA